MFAKGTESVSLKLSKEMAEKIKSGKYSFMRTKGGILKNSRFKSKGETNRSTLLFGN